MRLWWDYYPIKIDMTEEKEEKYHKISLNGGFMKSFMALNIINFANMTKRDKDRVSWDVSGVSSPWNSFDTVT